MRQTQMNLKQNQIIDMKCGGFRSMRITLTHNHTHTNTLKTTSANPPQIEQENIILDFSLSKNTTFKSMIYKKKQQQMRKKIR